MRLWMILLCLAMAGCFRTIETEPSGPRVPPRPPNPFDASFRPDGSRPDVGPAPFDGGEMFFDSAVFDSFAFDDAAPDGASLDGDVLDASFCPVCEFDFDCPQPPPFGCGEGICVAGVCDLGAGSCGGGEACDQDELICTPESVELRVRILSDYEPFVDFDRVVLKVDGRVVLQDTELAGDPVEGFDLRPVFVGDREELLLELRLYQGCNEIVSRRARVTLDESPFMTTVALTRDTRP